MIDLLFKLSFQHEKINYQKDFGVTECVWSIADNNDGSIALIFKIIKVKFSGYDQRFTKPSGF